jgi:signal transduction histidine kinase
MQSIKQFQSLLRRPLPVFFLFVAILMSAGFAFYLYQKKQIIAETHSNLSAIGSLKSAQIIQWRSERLADANMISNNLSLKRQIWELSSQPNDLNSKQELLVFMQNLANNNIYCSVILYDPEGRVKLACPSGDSISEPFILDLLNKSKLSDKVIFTDLYSSGSNRIKIDLLVPLFVPSKNNSIRAGTLLLRVDPEKMLFPLVQTWPTPSKTAETLLIRAEGKGVLYLNELRHRQHTALKLTLPISDSTLPASMAAKGIEGIVEGLDYRKVPVLASINKIIGSPWIMIAKVDQSEIYSPLRYQMLFIAIFFGVLIILGISLVRLWSINLRHRILRQELDDEIKVLEIEKQYRSLFENMLNGFAYCRMLYEDGKPCDFVYLDVNKSFESLTGLKNVKGKKVSEVIPGIRESDDQLFEIYGRVAQTGKPETFEMFVAALHDWYFISVFSTEREFFIAVFDVITKRKKTEEEIQLLNTELEKRVLERTLELEAANKELEAFSYSVSHDLRTPLRAISGFTQILSDDYGGSLDSEGKRICNVIVNNAIQMGHLIDDLLSFSQIGRDKIHNSLIDMKELSQQVFTELTTEAQKKNIIFSIMQLPKCFGDYALIKQVWTNLISNALKYSFKKEQPEISVSFEQTKEEIIYFITDNGVGFNMEYVNKLFGVFQRLHTNTEFEGTGVGLAIIQRIIQRHGGRVWAEGLINKGATFYFSIPLKTKNHEQF